MELNERQLFRKRWILKAAAGKCSNRQAAVALGLCVGRVKAVKREWKKCGDAAFVHGNTGRKPKRTMPQEEADRIIGIWNSSNKSGKRIFERTNFSHFASILKREYGSKRCRNTISKTLKAAGFVSPKSRRRKKRSVHPRRARREQFGELLQGDGTSFDIFGDGKKYCVHTFVDDATSIPLAMFITKNECAFGYYEILRQTFLKYGVPEALYMDGLDMFFNGKEKSEDISERTQFSQTLDKFGIELIRAHSPQAKGRIEKLNQTIQDRLTTELRLYNITTVEAANKFLPRFCDFLAKEFGVKPFCPHSKFVQLTENQKKDLAGLLSVRVERTTDSGCCFSLKNYLFVAENCRRKKVTVHLSIQGGIYVETKNGQRAAVRLLDDDDCGKSMPQVWKDLIGDYFFSDAKAKYRLPYSLAG